MSAASASSLIGRALIAGLALVPLVFVPGLGDGWVAPKSALLLALVAGSAGVSAFHRPRGNARPLAPSASALAFALALVACAAGWTVNGAWGGAEVRELALAGAAWLCLVAHRDPDGEGLALALRVLEWSAVAGALLVLAQAAGFDPIGADEVAGSIKWRAYGTMGNPNRMAQFLGLALLAMPSRRSWTRAVVGLALLATFSRGAWLMVAGVWISFALRARPAGGSAFRRWAPGAAVVAALALVSLLALAGLLPEAWLVPLRNTASVRGRWYHWLDSLALGWREGPWLGIGVGRYTLRPDVTAEYVHSEPIGIWVEGGLLTALPFLAGWGLRLREAWVRASASVSAARWDAPEAAGLRMLCGVTVVALYDFPLREPGVLALTMLAGIYWK